MIDIAMLTWPKETKKKQGLICAFTLQPLTEKDALTAGNLLLANATVPIADALIAFFVKTGSAEYVVTDDPHFKTLGVKTKWI